MIENYLFSHVYSLLFTWNDVRAAPLYTSFAWNSRERTQQLNSGKHSKETVWKVAINIIQFRRSGIDHRLNLKISEFKLRRNCFDRVYITAHNVVILWACNDILVSLSWYICICQLQRWIIRFLSAHLYQRSRLQKRSSWAYFHCEKQNRMNIILYLHLVYVYKKFYWRLHISKYRCIIEIQNKCWFFKFDKYIGQSIHK